MKNIYTHSVVDDIIGCCKIHPVNRYRGVGPYKACAESHMIPYIHLPVRVAKL